MPFARLLSIVALACLGLGCEHRTPATGAPAQKLRLTYTVKEGEKRIDFTGNPAWRPAWNDSMIARLERGAVPAYNRDETPVPAQRLQRERRVHGLVLTSDQNGHVQDDGVVLLPPRSAIGILHEGTGTPGVDFYFYDQSVSLEHFYARVHQADLEKLTGRPLEFVAVK